MARIFGPDCSPHAQLKISAELVLVAEPWTAETGSRAAEAEAESRAAEHSRPGAHRRLAQCPAAPSA